MFRTVIFRPIVISVLLVPLTMNYANAASVNSHASLTVQNSLSVEQIQSIDFGNILINHPPSMLADNDNLVVLSPQGQLTITGQDITYSKNRDVNVNALGKPGIFSVTHSAPFIDLTLDISDYSQLVHVADSEQNGRLHLSSFIASSPKNVNKQYISGDIINTDKTGKVELSFGASVTIMANKEYDDGLYTGTYSIQLHY